MATITRRGTEVHTSGHLPAVGAPAPAFTLTSADMADLSLQDLAGRRVVLNVFPSIDTPTCATSVRRFNELAAELPDTAVLCVSMDLPFAAARFCGAEGLDDVVVASALRSDFGERYGLTIVDSPMRGLLSRAVLVIDEEGVVRYAQQVAELSAEPDYDAALAALGALPR